MPFGLITSATSRSLIYRSRVWAGIVVFGVIAWLSAPAPAIAADCSPVITTLPDAVVVTFNDVGTCDWTVPNGVGALSNVLIVGGGGGGARDLGGGGGAGGLISLTGITVTPGAVLAVTVGDGGEANAVYGPAPLSDGRDSAFLGYVAKGGGAGGTGSQAGQAGGSGGGAGYGDGFGGKSGGSSTQVAPGVGFAGGGSGVIATSGGGGGGAGGIGGSAYPGGLVRDQGGTGGLGVSSLISGTLRFYAGGGGGGSAVNGTATSGGSGVGGNGGRINVTFSTAGAANTGSGGGGGGGGSGTNELGSRGGSGVVILRYGTAADSVARAVPIRTIDLHLGSATCATSSSISGDDGMWVRLPAAGQCQNGSQRLLGWATSPDFPTLAAGPTATDSVFAGTRMIYIPAGGFTYLSGDNSLYPVWSL